MELWIRNNTRIDISTEKLSLKETIDGIAYTLTTTIAETEAIRSLNLAKGDRISVYDYNYYTKGYWMFFEGVIWDISTNKQSRKINITAKERTVYLEESEDEYYWPEGQTASQRMMVIASDWGIPVGYVDDTQKGLAKALRKENLYGIIKKDLKETAQKGGSLYRVRMDEKLELIELGTNENIPILDSIIDEIEYKNSLDGTVTQVKVLGKKEKEETKSPIIGTFKQGTDDYGTIQKIVQDEKVDDYAKASDKANTLFSTGEDTIIVKCVIDINTLRAGNKVKLYGKDYIISEMDHDYGDIKRMNMTLMSWEGVKSKFYGE